MANHLPTAQRCNPIQPRQPNVQGKPNNIAVVEGETENAVTEDFECCRRGFSVANWVEIDPIKREISWGFSLKCDLFALDERYKSNALTNKERKDLVKF
ncbi:hypothetical protein C5167_025112 [Papaver somniferum]|uniref:Uncharacterized protein n=1 Tax=Papaver somniferum TaxID=3469 RepID=A0A4Y7JU63_PAPSO|nr:hypothetical protein C5167_025112 [Papaver somniferum]